MFVSGVSVGGAMRSTLELGTALATRGHSVDLIAGDRPEDRSLYGRLLNAHIKTASIPIVGRLGRWGVRRGSLHDAASIPNTGGRLVVHHATLPENAYRALLREGEHDVVVANSLPRHAMSWLDSDLRLRGVPFVIYLREAHSVSHFSVSNLRPAAAVANSLELRDGVQAAGFECSFVPSVVDLADFAVDTTREAVLLVNPVEAHRPGIVAKMAEQRPDITFVLQESWPLGAAGLERLATSPNVIVRERTDDSATIFRDARVLVAPYPKGRPRVVLEAHHNGIPVIACDQPALAEAVGPGGVLIPEQSDYEPWLTEVARCWDDPAWYETLVARSRSWAARDEIQPDHIVDQFEGVLKGLPGVMA